MRQRIFLIGILFVFCNAGATAQWTFAGLKDKYVMKLQILGREIYAATSDGLYRKNLDAPDTLWTAIGLQGQIIDAFFAINKDTIVAAHNFAFFEDTSAVYRTVNGGTDWISIKSSSLEYTYYLDTNAQQALLATQLGALYLSQDYGTNWHSVWSNQDMVGMGVHFIAHDAIRPSILWSGGETEDSHPYLLRSLDNGNSWASLALDAGGNNACYSAVVLPGQSDEVLTGMQGRIMKTSNAGQSWTTVYEVPGYRYIYGMAVSPNNDRTIYATGLRNSANSQSLALHRSTDGGQNWTTFEYVEELFNGTGRTDLAVDGSTGKDIVYVSTTRGVYTFSGQPTDVPDTPFLQTGIAVTPVPASDHIRLTLDTKQAAYCTATLYTLTGQEVVRLFAGFCLPGSQTIDWNASAQPNGLYLCVFHRGTETQVITVPVVR